MTHYQCPICGQEQSFQDEKEYGFCQRCGTKLLLRQSSIPPAEIREEQPAEPETSPFQAASPQPASPQPSQPSVLPAEPQMTEEQIHEKIQRGYDSYKAGRTQNAATAFEIVL